MIEAGKKIPGARKVLFVGLERTGIGLSLGAQAAGLPVREIES
jgi:hypothetical protein